MEVTIEEKNTFDRELKFLIPAAEIGSRMDEEVGRLVGQVKIPGFRPGKIPKKVIESRFKEHILSAVADQVFREVYPKAMEEHQLVPVDSPEVVVGELARGKDFTFTATIQILPKVEPRDYTGLVLTRQVADLGDEDIQKVLENIRKSHTSFQVREGRAAAKGDQVILDFAGFVDGEAFEGGKSEKFTLELGSGRFIPGFEEQLEGMMAQGDKEVNVTFPEGYGAPNLAGKAAVFKCHIHEVRESVVPEIDDELAKKTGVLEGGLAKLKEDIRDRMQTDARLQSERILKREILRAVLKVNPMEIPQRMEDRERVAMIEQAKKEYKSQGLDTEKIGIADEALIKDLEFGPGDRVRLGLLLNAIAEKEKLEVTEDRVQEQVKEMTLSFGERAAEVQKMLREDKDRMEGLRSSIMEGLVIEFLTTHGQVTDQHCSLDELMTNAQEKGK